MMEQDPRITLHRHATPADWVTAATAAILRPLGAPGPHRLLLSGGNTPAPVYRALAEAQLDWQQLALGLVDERWLPDGDANRNDQLVDTHLLSHQPLARLMPLARTEAGWEGSADAASAWWKAGPVPVVAVLGMGNDSHTASLFPDAAGLAEVAVTDAPYAALDATGCPGAQGWPRRLTLTPSGLRAIDHRLLLLRGQEKRDVLAAALADGDPARHPVLHALSGRLPLQVHWCP